MVAVTNGSIDVDVVVCVGDEFGMMVVTSMFSVFRFLSMEMP